MKENIIRVAVNQDFQYLLPESEVAILFNSNESVGKGKVLEIQNNEYLIELDLYSEIDLVDKEIIMSISETSSYVNNIRENLSSYFCLLITSKNVVN